MPAFNFLFRRPTRPGHVRPGFFLAYEAANKDTRLMIDTPPRKARQILQRLNDTMAQAVPDGPLGAAFMALAIPLGATRVPASAVPDLQKGKTPPCIAARQRLASIVSSATAGSGSAYLATLRAWRLCVSDMLTTDQRFSMWQKTYTKCAESIFIDQDSLNERRPSSSADAEPTRPLRGRASSWLNRGPRPGAICTAAMQAST